MNRLGHRERSHEAGVGEKGMEAPCPRGCLARHRAFSRRRLCHSSLGRAKAQPTHRHWRRPRPATSRLIPLEVSVSRDSQADTSQMGAESRWSDEQMRFGHFKIDVVGVCGWEVRAGVRPPHPPACPFEHHYNETDAVLMASVGQYRGTFS